MCNNGITQFYPPPTLVPTRMLCIQVLTLITRPYVMSVLALASDFCFTRSTNGLYHTHIMPYHMENSRQPVVINRTKKYYWQVLQKHNKPSHVTDIVIRKMLTCQKTVITFMNFEAAHSRCSQAAIYDNFYKTHFSTIAFKSWLQTSFSSISEGRCYCIQV